MVNQPYTIDLYQGDNVIDYPGRPLGGFAQVKALGIAFLDHKASQGINERDSRCAVRRAVWMDGSSISVIDTDGISLTLQPRFGFYHFNGTGAPTVEAANFKSAVMAAGYASGDDLTLDWEDIGASGYQQPAAWADDFCKFTEDWCGFAIKIYGGDTPREQLAAAPSSILDNFARRRLWFCEYGTFNPSLLPVPWRESGPLQWQDDGDSNGPGPHTISGVSNYCDNSTVVGTMTVSTLNSLWAGGSNVSS
jgi:hypothetical protein